MCPCARRAAARPRGHTWNRTGRTGRATAGRPAPVGTPERARSAGGRPGWAGLVSARSWAGGRLDMASELVKRQGGCGRCGRDEVVAGLERELAHDGPEPPSQAVAGHRRTGRPRDGIRHSNGLVSRAANGGDHDRPGPAAGAGLAECREGAPAVQTAGTRARRGRHRTNERRSQAERRWRPLSRRARRMARPARVDMRCRKPCRFARFRLLG